MKTRRPGNMLPDAAQFADELQISVGSAWPQRLKSALTVPSQFFLKSASKNSVVMHAPSLLRSCATTEGWW